MSKYILPTITIINDKKLLFKIHSISVVLVPDEVLRKKKFI